MKTVIRPLFRLLLLLMIFLILFSGCAAPAPETKQSSALSEETPTLERMAQYNASASYRNLIEEMVHGKIADYADCFGLGDEPIKLKDDFSSQNQSKADTAALFKALDKALEGCYATIYDASLAHLLMNTDEAGRTLLEKFSSFTLFLKDGIPSTETFAFQKTHQELISLVDSYLAAAKHLDETLHQEKQVLDQEELAFSEKNHLFLRQSMQQFSQSCEQILAALHSGNDTLANESLPAANQALSLFLKQSQDSAQAAKEGYPADSLASLYHAGEQLTAAFSACLKGKTSVQAAGTAYANFASYYNSLLSGQIQAQAEKALPPA